jgi:proline-specific peptidase
MESISLATQEGYVVFKHSSLPSDTECRTWYKIVGNISSNKRPLVTLHGGPGAAHNCLTRTFDLYAAKTDTPVIYYDQIGSGKGWHLRQKRGDEAFWTPDLFVAELDNLGQQLGIRDNFDLYGHSWGAKLAAKYAASPSTAGSRLNKVILASGSCRQKDLAAAIQILLERQPKHVRDTIRKYSKEKQYDVPEYKEAMGNFYRAHLCRLDPWPPTLIETLAATREDDTVYWTMLGPDPFNTIGCLRGN